MLMKNDQRNLLPHMARTNVGACPRVTACDGAGAGASKNAAPANQILEILVSERDQTRPPSTGNPRKSWTPPKIDDLPRLENLTLQTGIGGPIDGPSIFP